MTRKEKAVDLFRKQLNCSQAVFAAYRQPDKLDEPTALKLATVFGAGMAGTGEGLCGAVTGALMAISLKHGRADVQSAEAKARTYELGRLFVDRFKEKIGACRCEEIIGFNIGTPENLAKARQMKLFETRCLEAVKAAADVLEELL